MIQHYENLLVDTKHIYHIFQLNSHPLPYTFHFFLLHYTSHLLLNTTYISLPLLIFLHYNPHVSLSPYFFILFFTLISFFILSAFILLYFFLSLIIPFFPPSSFTSSYSFSSYSSPYFSPPLLFLLLVLFTSLLLFLFLFFHILTQSHLPSSHPLFTFLLCFLFLSFFIPSVPPFFPYALSFLSSRPPATPSPPLNMSHLPPAFLLALFTSSLYTRWGGRR